MRRETTLIKTATQDPTNEIMLRAFMSSISILIKQTCSTQASTKFIAVLARANAVAGFFVVVVVLLMA